MGFFEAEEDRRKRFAIEEARRQQDRVTGRHGEAVDGRFIVEYPLINIQKAIENGHRNSELSH